MDCDRVFVVLTSAPFPTGTPIDADLERHVAACDGCRRFAEALRPAADCRHEVLPERERNRLPQYRTSRRPVATNAAGRSGALSTPVLAAPQRGSGHRGRAQFGLGSYHPQVASFTVAPPAPRRVWWDMASLAALVVAIAACGWGFGVLAM